jgi:hypothetical protein
MGQVVARFTDTAIFSLPGSALTALVGDATSQCILFARGIRGEICGFDSGTLALLLPANYQHNQYYQLFKSNQLS